jgi:hypothetical protein
MVTTHHMIKIVTRASSLIKHGEWLQKTYPFIIATILQSSNAYASHSIETLDSSGRETIDVYVDIGDSRSPSEENKHSEITYISLPTDAASGLLYLISLCGDIKNWLIK